MKKIFICQSNYIPWRGYFEAIAQADAFVLYDEVQYTRLDWRNRNTIKTPRGLQWLSIPLKKWHLGDSISSIKAQQNWQQKHLNLIKENYRTAPFFQETFPFIENLYQESKQKTHLSDINHFFLQNFCENLGINTPFYWSSAFGKNENILSDQRNGRLIQICQQLEATHYLSGSAAKVYLDEKLFEANDLKVEWLQYVTPQYPQQFGDFASGVSIIDAFFNIGIAASKNLFLK